MELEESGTIIDILNKAHKRGLIDSIEEIRELKELRNIISHEYAGAKLKMVFESVFKHTPTLFKFVEKAQSYSKKYLSE